MPLVQHKREAYWFYRFLSLVYDTYVNPLFWTERMRSQALSLARLDDSGLRVIDVGSGTGFTTQGIVRSVPAAQVVCVDQSPHQMRKARAKTSLQGCTFILGDAERIPYETDRFDRYVSAGSIEYWPDPRQGICEAYRVVKPGGIALMIGPLEPAQPIIRWIACTWMLFPREEDYRRWFSEAGFEDVRTLYIRPQWYRGNEEYAVAIAGMKQRPGDALACGDSRSTDPVETAAPPARGFRLLGRVVVGSFLGFLFIPIALALYFKNRYLRVHPIPPGDQERLNAHQVTALLLFGAVVVALGWWMIV